MFSDEHTAIQPDVNPDTRQPREDGWFLMSRCIFEHPIVGARAGHPRITPKNPNPIPYGWAWIWLLREAAYKSRTKVVRGKSYKLNVGELACSESFMAEAWGWGDKAVQCFLRKLRDHKMIIWGAQKGTEVRILTVCNYPRYQMKLQVEWTSAGTTEADFREPTRKKVINKSKTPPTPSRGDEPELPFISEADAQNDPKAGHDTLTKVGNTPAQEASEVRIAFDRWNQTAAKLGLKPATRFSAARAAKIRARLKEGGLEAWDKALAEVTRSKFLRGKVPPSPGRPQFVAHLDFLLQPSSYDKILEGVYTRKPSDVITAQGGPTANAAEQRQMAELDALRRERGLIK